VFITPIDIWRIGVELRRPAIVAASVARQPVVAVPLDSDRAALWADRPGPFHLLTSDLVFGFERGDLSRDRFPVRLGLASAGNSIQILMVPAHYTSSGAIRFRGGGSGVLREFMSANNSGVLSNHSPSRRCAENPI
jgi:hypothetical protein